MGVLGNIIRRKFGLPEVEPEGLTPEQIEERKQKIAEYTEQLKEDKTVEFLNAKQLLRQLYYAEKELKIGTKKKPFDWNKYGEHIDLLACYCLGYKKWGESFADMIKNPDPDPTKGIMIIGNTGSGKTSIFRLFSYVCNRHNLRNTMRGRLVSAHQISTEFSNGGYEAVEKYLNHGLIIDDFGAENLASNYGNKLESCGYIIEERYNLFTRHGVKTFATSNLKMSEIQDRYGDRVHSRLHEMFNIVYLVGDDLRKS